MTGCFCIGESCIDIHLPELNRIPNAGELIIDNNIALTLGGSAAYTALCLARLGTDSWLKLKVGRDQTAGVLRQLLTVEQIKTIVDEDPDETTQLSLTFSRPDGKGYIATKPIISVPDREEIAGTGTKALHVAGYLLFPELWTGSTFDLLNWARSNGIITALDSQMCAEPGQEKHLFEKELFKNLDVLFMDEKEVCNFFQTDNVFKVINDLRALGVPIITVKMGSTGSLTITSQKAFKMPAYPVKPSNTVGAGDIYNGAFLYALLHNWPLNKVAAFANIVAGFSTTERSYKKILKTDQASELMNQLQEEIL